MVSGRRGGRHEQATCPGHALGDHRPAAARRAAQTDRGPAKLHADEADAIPRCRAVLRQRRIADRIAREGIAASDRLGRHRWVVERSLAWLGQCRRPTVRYERRAAIHEAVLTLGCALLCVNAIDRFR